MWLGSEGRYSQSHRLQSTPSLGIAKALWDIPATVLVLLDCANQISLDSLYAFLQISLGSLYREGKPFLASEAVTFVDYAWRTT